MFPWRWASHPASNHICPVVFLKIPSPNTHTHTRTHTHTHTHRGLIRGQMQRRRRKSWVSRAHVATLFSASCLKRPPGPGPASGQRAVWAWQHFTADRVPRTQAPRSNARNQCFSQPRPCHKATGTKGQVARKGLWAGMQPHWERGRRQRRSWGRTGWGAEWCKAGRRRLDDCKVISFQLK